MPREKEPSDKPAQRAPNDANDSDSLSLVDLFDQMDRDAFRRSLEHRDVSRIRFTTD